MKKHGIGYGGVMSQDQKKKRKQWKRLWWKCARSMT